MNWAGDAAKTLKQLVGPLLCLNLPGVPSTGWRSRVWRNCSSGFAFLSGVSEPAAPPIQSYPCNNRAGCLVRPLFSGQDYNCSSHAHFGGGGSELILGLLCSLHTGLPGMIARCRLCTTCFTLSSSTALGSVLPSLVLGKGKPQACWHVWGHLGHLGRGLCSCSASPAKALPAGPGSWL